MLARQSCMRMLGGSKLQKLLPPFCKSVADVANSWTEAL